MKRERMHINPTRNSELTFEDLYAEISHDWKRRAENLQIRRWRALKRELKGGY